MSIPVLLLSLLLVFFFSWYGRKTILGFWGSFFFLLLVSVLLFPGLGGFSTLPGAAIILFLGGLKRRAAMKNDSSS